jgi:hypothetical protein
MFRRVSTEGMLGKKIAAAVGKPKVCGRPG